MDVRCERCQTEYELEDDNVSDSGTAVQCTACDHTFTVTRSAVASGGTGTESTPPLAEWLLETSEGPAHRFRNLTSLQKWIVERKVTRDDRISRTGQAWRRLGEIVELAAFFDVVDDADQARAAVMTERSLKHEAQEARRTTLAEPARGAFPGAESLIESDEPLPEVRLPPGSVLRFEDEPHTEVVRLSSGTVLRFVVLLAVAILVSYVGITQIWKRPSEGPFSRRGTARPVPVAQAAARPFRPSVVPLRAAATPPPLPNAPEATSGAGVPPVSPAPAAPVPAVADLDPRSAAPVTPSEPPLAPVLAPQPEAPVSYENLIAEGDRLQARGSTDRAGRLYERARKLRPDGAEALAGIGYVALDRGRNDRALRFFKRSTAASPTFGPALFGLGEALRATGDEQLALEHYRRYITVDPQGTDVAIALRQIELIEARLAARAK
jgi:predicted Zn finger-like uncharacterized protein